MIVRVFTCAILVLSPLLTVLVSEKAMLIPGFPRKSNTTAAGDSALDPLYTVYLGTFLAVDLLSFALISVTMHMNEQRALRPWRIMCGDVQKVPVFLIRPDGLRLFVVLFVFHFYDAFVGIAAVKCSEQKESTS